MASIFSNPKELILRLLSVVLVLTVHEFSHGLAAHLLGDRTAKRQGRLSLNPLKHVDWFGLVALLLFRFGWAKPVNIDPRNFKNPKVDLALTAAAGPVSNIIFAFLLMFIVVPNIDRALATMLVGGSGFTYEVFSFVQNTAILSLNLGFFNMLPIPPLDGSKIFGALLPDRLYFRYIGMGQIGMIILIVLMYMDMVGAVIGPLVITTYTFMVDVILKVFS